MHLTDWILEMINLMTSGVFWCVQLACCVLFLVFFFAGNRTGGFAWRKCFPCRGGHVWDLNRCLHVTVLYSCEDDEERGVVINMVVMLCVEVGRLNLLISWISRAGCL